MKNLLYLFLFCFVLPNVIKAQGNNPCGKEWSEWRTAWSLPNGEVEFRLEFPSKKCGCGYNYVELKHSLPYTVKITVRLEGYDCDGKKYGERFFSDAIVGGEISKKGSIYHWFGSMPSAVAVILEYEEGGKKIRLEKNYAGTKKYINGMSEAAYNQQQQQKSTASSTSSTTKPSGGTANNSSTNTPRPNSSTNTSLPNPSTSTSTASQQQVQLAEQQRLQREEALRKQQEAERRQREEAFRQNELRYQAQLQEITRKSEARAQRDASIMDGFAGVFSIIQKNKAERGLREDAGKRSSKLSEYKKKLAEGGYELIDCPHCVLDGFNRCGQCKSKGSIKCNSCNGEAGKSCSNCGGTGKKGYGPYQVACFNCSGTGKRKCLPCGNEGSNICFLCNGRSERQCGHCEGTGKMLTGVINQREVERLPTYKYKVNEPIKQVKLDFQLSLDSTIVSSEGFYKRAANIQKGIDSIYYLGYRRIYANNEKGILYLKIFVVYRYSDGSFPMLIDIQNISKHDPYVNEKGCVKLLGYFEDLTSTMKTMDELVRRARAQETNVVQDRLPRQINPVRTNQIKANDFWNN